MSFNKIIIIGNLGKDPELRYTPQGDAVCSFSLATNEKRRDKSGVPEDITTWFKVTLWRRTAENAAKYLTRGSTVYIEGRLRIEEWTDRENNNRYTLDVQGTDMHFIGPNEARSDGDRETPHSTSPPNAPAANVPAAGKILPDDDIPF